VTKVHVKKSNFRVCVSAPLPSLSFTSIKILIRATKQTQPQKFTVEKEKNHKLALAEEEDM
jgi:hypothetical protein